MGRNHMLLHLFLYLYYHFQNTVYCQTFRDVLLIKHTLYKCSTFLHHTNFSSTDKTLSPHPKRLPHVAVHSSLPSVYIHSPTWKVHSCYKQQTINYHKCSRLVRSRGTQASLSCDQGHALLGTWTIGNLDYWELGVQSSYSDVIYKFFWGPCLIEIYLFQGIGIEDTALIHIYLFKCNTV